MLARVLVMAVAVAAATADVVPAAQLELFEGADEQTYFRVLIGSDKVLRSEGYTSKSGATNGLGSVVLNGIAAVNYKVKEAADGRWYFALRAQNYQTIATSSGFFASEAAAVAQVETVVLALRALLHARQDVYVGVEGASFVLLVSSNGNRHFHLRAVNGQRLLFAHGFESEGAARDAMVQVFVEGHAKRLFGMRTNAVGHFFFELVADGRQLAVSHMFATEAQRDAMHDLAHFTLRELVQQVVAAATATSTAVPAPTTALPVTTLPTPPPTAAGPTLLIGADVPCSFERMTNSLVAAYEQLGALAAHYAEDGFCGEGCESVWLRKTTNPTIATRWLSFEASQHGGGRCAGKYAAFVDFFSFKQGEGYKRIELTFDFSGEDVLVDLKVVNAPLFTFGRMVTPGWVGQAAAVNCPSSTAGSVACSEWTLFSKLRDEFRNVVGAQGYTQLVAKEPDFEEVEGLLRTRTIWSRVWSDADIAVLRNYYVANEANIVMKFMDYEEQAWDTKGTIIFVYNKATREVVVIDKLVAST